MPRIRRFRKEDATATARLIEAALKEVSARYYPRRIIGNLVKAYSRNGLLDRMATRRGFVAMEGGVIAGTIQLTNDGWVGGLFVHPEFQQHGVGTRLLKRAEQEAKSQGFDALRSHVAINSVGFYKKLGFRVVKQVVFREAGRTYRMIKKLR